MSRSIDNPRKDSVRIRRAVPENGEIVA
jgi:hypothetical protein